MTLIGRALRLAAVAVAASLGLAAPISGAFAHASLVASNPSDGAVTQAAPTHITLRFNEPVSPLAIRLIDAAGATHADLAVSARDETIDVALPPDLPTGTQTLSYRILSLDGHPVGGALAFSIGAPTGAARIGAGAIDPLRAAAIWLTRAIQYAGLFVGVGGVFFIAWIGHDANRTRVAHWLYASLVAAFAAIVASIGLQGLDILDAPFPALFTQATWTAGLDGSYGLGALAAMGAALVAGAALVSRRGPARRALAATALAILGAAFAATGHAASAGPSWLTRPAVFLHAAGAAVWLGALMPLMLSMRGAGAPLESLRRFSLIGLVVVPILLTVGVALALVQFDTVRALTTTPYGRIFSVKMVAVLALLALAAANFFVLTPGVARDGGAARRWLARSIAAELALMAAIVMLVAGWRLTAPPRALEAAAPSSPEILRLHGARMMASLGFSPGRVGANHVHVDVLSGDFKPLHPEEVRLTLAPKSGAIEPRSFLAKPDGQGGFDVDQALAPLPGLWTIEVSALIDDFTKIELSGEREFAK